MEEVAKSWRVESLNVFARRDIVESTVKKAKQVSNDRAVFNWVSKVIRVLLWFCFTSLCDWLKPFAPLSRPIKSKTQTNQSWLARARTRFPALGAGYMYLLRVLIGSLGNLCLLWLAGVITLVLVLRHSFEKRSIVRYIIIHERTLLNSLSHTHDTTDTVG